MHNRQNDLRFSAVAVALIFCLFFFAGKLIFIQLFSSLYLSDLAEKQHNHLIEIEPLRGTIYDRNMHPLALNIQVYSLCANPRLMSEADRNEAVARLPGILGFQPDFIKEKLSRKKDFVWLKRKMPYEEVQKIKQLKIKGLDFLKESKRFYPDGPLASHVIGFAGIDNAGLEGTELVYNNQLKGKSGWTKVIRDARQRDLMIDRGFIAPQDGYNLVLTIDETIQYIAESTLERAFHKHNAIAATIIVIDVKTGEVLALVNRPTYDLSKASLSTIESRTNRAVSFVYEPGSVFKIVAASAMFEEGAFKETDKIFCENGAYRVANHILHDHESHGTLTVREVFEKSSNIGVTKIAQKLGPEAIYKYARRFRFGLKTNIDLKGEVDGLLKSPSKWSKTSIGAIPIGHEVTVTPFQLIGAITSLANNGIYMQPFIVKYITDRQDNIIRSFEPKVVDRVVSPEVAQKVNSLLVGVVENGTGKLAKIPGIKVAGKTGTAQKVVNGTYSHDQFFATFMGFAPADNPRLAAIVVFDNPHPGHFGGTVCAPVFKEVIESSLRYLDSKNLSSGQLTLKPTKDMPITHIYRTIQKRSDFGK